MSLSSLVIRVSSAAMSIPLLLFRPFRGYWNRIYYMAVARSRISGLSATIQFEGRIETPGTGRITIGPYGRFGAGVELETQGAGRIDMGTHARINRGCTFCSSSAITLRNYVLIGEYTSLRDANHGTKRGEYMRLQPHDTRPIKIGHDVWIGRGSCILPGVTIGDGAIVGANSVVTKDIPPNTIAAGSPASVIGERR